MVLLRTSALRRQSNPTDRVGRRRMLTATAAGLFASSLLPLASASATTPAATTATTTPAAATASTTPAAATTTTGPDLAVDAGADRHAISPDIYGMNFADPTLAAQLQLPVERWGGNRSTRYDYRTGTSNAGSDWYYFSDPNDPDADTFIQRDRAAGTRTVLTVPIIGRETLPVGSFGEHQCSFSVAKYGPQQATEPWHPDCGNGAKSDGTPIVGNDPNDTSTAVSPAFAGDWVRQLVTMYGDAAHGGVPIYELDNEPALWSSTHRDIHPAPLTYDELWTKTQGAAAAIKGADPTAATMGPSDWGWCAYFFAPDDDPGDACAAGPDAQAHGNVPLAEWYLQQAAAYQARTGVRPLDYFDEHYYPQSGVALTGAGDANQQAKRLRSTRSLWDPTYTDESWIGDQVRLIPRMHEWIDRDYPGTKLAMSEYNFGGLESMNGALTEADVLGIFARERVDLATLWAPPAADTPGAFAFRMFRNYDGTGGSFGDTWVRATSGDQSRVAVYAAQRSADGSLTVLLVNKTDADLTSNLTLSGADTSGTAARWQYSPANLSAVVAGGSVPVAASGPTAVTVPANSLTMLVVPPKATGTAPGAPTAVQAAAGDGTAHVSWQPPTSTGDTPITGVPITSYSLTATSVTGAQVSASVAGARTTADLAGLENGTPYRFSVTATNAAGTGPASAASAWLVPGPAGQVLRVQVGGAANPSAAPRQSVSIPVTVTRGSAAAPVGQVDLWDDTAQRYLASTCASTAPGSGGYTCIGSFDSDGVHQLRATYHDPSDGLAGRSLPYAQTVLSPPTAVTASAGDGRARVTWTAPASSLPISGYTVTAAPGGKTVTITGATSADVTGLTNGTRYTFTVTTRSAALTSPASAASNAVTPSPPGPPLAIPGASSRTTTYGAIATVAGTAPAGASVGIWFQQAGTTTYTLRRGLTASSAGAWSTTYVAGDDYRIYATSGSGKTAPVLIQVAPTISGAASRVVRKGSTCTITGTGIPGRVVTLHMHKAGTASTDYSLLRSATIRSNGTWSLSYLASVDYRFYASLPNGRVSPTVLVQAR